jgi:hypothetical protein
VSWFFVAIGVAAGAVALAIGLPAWRTWQARAAQDRNAERYLAWRGRGDRTESATAQQMTTDERRRIGLAAGLVAVAVACLIIGLST